MLLLRRVVLRWTSVEGFIFVLHLYFCLGCCLTPIPLLARPLFCYGPNRSFLRSGSIPFSNPDLTFFLFRITILPQKFPPPFRAWISLFLRFLAFSSCPLFRFFVLSFFCFVLLTQHCRHRIPNNSFTKRRSRIFANIIRPPPKQVNQITIFRQMSIADRDRKSGNLGKGRYSQGFWNPPRWRSSHPPGKQWTDRDPMAD